MDDKDASSILHLAEPDYRFGTGSLTVLVHAVVWTRPLTYDGDTWFEVHGTQITPDGRTIGPRQVVVRGTTLHAFRRPA